VGADYGFGAAEKPVCALSKNIDSGCKIMLRTKARMPEQLLCRAACGGIAGHTVKAAAQAIEGFVIEPGRDWQF
jgi:hypothetical protein